MMLCETVSAKVSLVQPTRRGAARVKTQQHSTHLAVDAHVLRPAKDRLSRNSVARRRLDELWSHAQHVTSKEIKTRASKTERAGHAAWPALRSSAPKQAVACSNAVANKTLPVATAG
jgi:hypothetical protein